MIIDIDNIEESQYKEQEFNGIISLNENENETTIYEIKDGGKTELKKDRKRLEKKRKREKNSSPTHIYGLYSESKRINVPKKLGKVYENKLGYHFILEKWVECKMANAKENNKKKIFEKILIQLLKMDFW